MEWIERIKRKHRCRVHFDNDSFRVHDYMLVQVHMIPEEMALYGKVWDALNMIDSN